MLGDHEDVFQGAASVNVNHSRLLLRHVRISASLIKRYDASLPRSVHNGGCWINDSYRATVFPVLVPFSRTGSEYAT